MIETKKIHLVSIDIEKSQNYKLANKNYTLYAKNENTVCPKAPTNVEDVSDSSKSMREIANFQSLSGGQGIKNVFVKVVI